MQALAQLMIDTPNLPAWVSFSCRDGQHINDGAPIVDCASFLDGVAQVVAVGINCTPPSLIPSLIREVRSVTQKPIVVYPFWG